MRTVTDPPPETRRFLGKWKQCLSLGRQLQTFTWSSFSREMSDLKQLLGAYLTDHRIHRSVNVEPSSVWIHGTPFASNTFTVALLEEAITRNNKNSNEHCYLALFSLFCTVDWVKNKVSRGIIDKSAIKFTRDCDCISKLWEIYCVIVCNMSLIITASGKCS